MYSTKRFVLVLPTLLVACATTQSPLPTGMTHPERGKTPQTHSQEKMSQTTAEKTGVQEEAKTMGKKGMPASGISSWELSGAIAARSQNKAWSASVNWLQRGQGAYQIRLLGPLGSGTVLIQKQGGTISFKDGPKTATSSNADQLLYQQTGVRLPVSKLYYWVRGIPAPGGVQAAQKDGNDRLQVLKQDGYTVTYGGYTTVAGKQLPSQIKLQGRGVFVKLVVNRWRI